VASVHHLTVRQRILLRYAFRFERTVKFVALDEFRSGVPAPTFADHRIVRRANGCVCDAKHHLGAVQVIGPQVAAGPLIAATAAGFS
jgi:hypothetical protein